MNLLLLLLLPLNHLPAAIMGKTKRQERPSITDDAAADPGAARKGKSSAKACRSKIQQGMKDYVQYRYADASPQTYHAHGTDK